MTDTTQEKLKEIEAQMNAPDFWSDKERAQTIIRQYEHLKAEAAGEDVLGAGNAIITVFSGAGGLDAEDFARMLTEMYWKFVEKRGWSLVLVHENRNDHNGIRNITFEVSGKGAYGTLKNESGVHRLVRISPFNAQKKRHTAFAMVEVIPKFKEAGEMEIPESELSVEFSRSSGPGGQNVNKRETAVRVVHASTGIAVHVDSERSQQQNRERALEMLRGKLYRRQEEERRAKERGMHISTTTDAEWGSQIRSYVLHPYKLVKDHRTNVEVHDVEKVLEDGELDAFLEAEQAL